VLLSLTRVDDATIVASAVTVILLSTTLSNTVVVTVSPADKAPDSLTLVESAPNDAEPVNDALPPLVANPETVILALAIGVPEPNLTLLQTATIVDVAVIGATPDNVA